MKHSAEELEKEDRVQDLSPLSTLKEIGIEPQNIICDIGAGSGLFTIPAAQLTQGDVYAIDIDADLLDLIQSRSKEAGLSNIRLIQPTDFSYPILDETVDLLLMVTVYHELDGREALLREIKRIIKPQGRVALIEFPLEETPIGPPLDHRIDSQVVVTEFEAMGYTLSRRFPVGSSFYCMIFALEK